MKNFRYKLLILLALVFTISFTVNAQNIGADCPQEVGPPQIYDCYLNCARVNKLGNGICQDGSDGTANFNCSELDYDEGDCPGTTGEVCTWGIGGFQEIQSQYDCDGNCLLGVDYNLGNGTCNDGDGGYINLSCSEFEYDYGDCPGTPDEECFSPLTGAPPFIDNPEYKYDCNGVCRWVDGSISNSTCQDGSNGGINLYCEAFNDDNDFCVPGCMNFMYMEYTMEATSDDGSCVILVVEGCMDALAFNYNELANIENNSCISIVEGCMTAGACNYSASANVANECFYANGVCQECVGSETNGIGSVFTLDTQVGGVASTVSNGICDANEVGGCMDPNACNYIATNTYDDSSCLVPNGCQSCNSNNYLLENDDDGDDVCNEDEIIGCQDIIACNYDPTATDDSDLCEYVTDNYNCENGCLNDADTDGICDEYEVIGCQDATACNYKIDATDADLCIYSIDLNACATCSGESNGDGFIVDNDLDNDGVCNANEIEGCTDISAFNFNAFATDNDDSCYSVVEGCMDSTAFNYNDLDGNNYSDGLTDSLGIDINTDDGSCYIIVEGCMDSTAFNYNDLDGANFSDDFTGVLGVDINTDDGSCYIIVEGCMDPLAFNYNDLDGNNYSDTLTGTLGIDINTDDGSCYIIVEGCMDSTAFNYNDLDGNNFSDALTDSLGIDINTDDGSCYIVVEGCMNPSAFNYNDLDGNNFSDALTETLGIDVNTDDGSCYIVVEGCMDSTAFNYNDLNGDNFSDLLTETLGIDINTDDGSCYIVVEGCMNPSAFNYNDLDGNNFSDALTETLGIDVNTDDGSCYIVVEGCMDSTAFNYNDLDGDNLSDNLTGELGVDINTDNGSCYPFVYGCMNPSAFNYNDVNQDGFSNSLTGILGIDVNIDNESCSSLVDYQFSMSITSILENLDGSYSIDPNDQVSVFNEDGVCVGTSQPSFYLASIHANAIFLMVYSNQLSQSYSVQVYSSSTGTIETYMDLNFSSNASIGTIQNPYIFQKYPPEIIEGCLDATAFNYNVEANNDDGTCVDVVYGCTDNQALNYSMISNTDDGSCIVAIEGCTDFNYVNYNPEANLDDSSCGITWQQAYLNNNNIIDSLFSLLFVANDTIQVLRNQILNTIPEDGIGQSDVEAVQLIVDNLQITISSLVASNTMLTSNNEQLTTDLNIALSNQEIHIEEVRIIDVPEGWSMFGYPCSNNLNVIDAFVEHIDVIQIVKDQWGLVWLVEWDYNAIGSLQYGEGYQIKTTEAIENFQFCPSIE